MSQSTKAIAVAPRRDEIARGIPGQSARPATNAPSFGVLSAVHRLLRGRYLIAIPLGIVLGVAGLIVGYRTPQLSYRSTGMIRIKPILPKVMYSSEQNNVMPMFDAYVESQVLTISSRRVVDLCMQQPEYKALGRSLDPQVVADFQKNLKVSRFKGSDIIQIAFVDQDPQAATTVVQSMIAAYHKVYDETNTDSSRLQILEERRTTLGNELKGINDRILNIAQEFGSDSLDPIYNYKLAEQNKLESELKQAQFARATAEALQAKGTTRPVGERPAQIATQTQAATQPTVEERPPEVIALVDKQMDQYLSQRLAQRGEIGRLEARLGSENPRVGDAKAVLVQIDEQIKERVRFFQRAEAAGYVGLPSRRSAEVAATPENLEALRERERRIEGLHEAAKQELVSVGRKRLQIDQLRADASGVRAKLEETKARIEQLNVEGNMGGRLEIISTGDRPVLPDNDQRLRMAMAGATGGLVGGMGLIMLFGLIDRRVRYVEDAHGMLSHNVSLLGVLPELPTDLSDPSQALVAGQCVHHIRALLQIQRLPERDKVLAVTSPAPGSGKTSLTSALGLSFAACGSRTLLIDCDMVGGGLTAKMDAITRRRVGRILRREGLVSEAAMDEAVNRARASNRRVGEVLAEMGHVSAQDVERALTLQAESVAGLLDALEGEPVADCISATAVPGLFILPLGEAGAHHVPQLSPTALRRILDDARRDYDTIIVDTGPMLGSMEAAFVTAEADKVVMVLARGEQRSHAQRALQSLYIAGTALAGVVFNRAQSEDVARSSYSSGSGPLSQSQSRPAKERSPLGFAVNQVSERR
jgi:succinoglycan biosynthesis transport protein ExoP